MGSTEEESKKIRLLHTQRLAREYMRKRQLLKGSRATKDAYQEWSTSLQSLILDYIGKEYEVYQILTTQVIDNYGDEISKTFDLIMNQKWAEIYNLIINNTKINLPVEHLKDTIKKSMNKEPLNNQPQYIQPFEEFRKKQNNSKQYVPYYEEFQAQSNSTSNSRQKDPTTKENSVQGKKKVFIVHGHDKPMRETVKKYIKSLGIETIILSERATGNKTLLDKLRSEAKNVDFAVVLYTPCDEGREANSNADLEYRARENVVLELGYFSALLEDKVAILFRKPQNDNKKFDFPNDFRGIVYIDYHPRKKSWKESLKKEFEKAGII